MDSKNEKEPIDGDMLVISICLIIVLLISVWGLAKMYKQYNAEPTSWTVTCDGATYKAIRDEWTKEFSIDGDHWIQFPDDECVYIQNPE